MYGWAGQRLRVYLTEGKIVKEPLSEEMRLNFLGGRGFNSKTLPKAYLTEQETPWGVTGVSEAKFQVMLDEFYRTKGWDHEGIPTVEKLEELGLSYIAEQIRPAEAATAP